MCHESRLEPVRVANNRLKAGLQQFAEGNWTWAGILKNPVPSGGYPPFACRFCSPAA
jgi:hypothetical protein